MKKKYISFVTSALSAVAAVFLLTCTVICIFQIRTVVKTIQNVTDDLSGIKLIKYAGIAYLFAVLGICLTLMLAFYRASLAYYYFKIYRLLPRKKKRDHRFFRSRGRCRGGVHRSRQHKIGRSSPGSAHTSQSFRRLLYRSRHTADRRTCLYGNCRHPFRENGLKRRRSRKRGNNGFARGGSRRGNVEKGRSPVRKSRPERHRRTA